MRLSDMENRPTAASISAAAIPPPTARFASDRKEANSKDRNNEGLKRKLSAKLKMGGGIGDVLSHEPKLGSYLIECFKTKVNRGACGRYYPIRGKDAINFYDCFKSL